MANAPGRSIRSLPPDRLVAAGSCRLAAPLQVQPVLALVKVREERQSPRHLSTKPNGGKRSLPDSPLPLLTGKKQPLCHPREGGYPERGGSTAGWIAACAAMTEKVADSRNRASSRNNASSNTPPKENLRCLTAPFRTILTPKGTTPFPARYPDAWTNRFSNLRPITC